MKNIAIILAGGIGSRFKETSSLNLYDVANFIKNSKIDSSFLDSFDNRPKQYIKIQGKIILEYSLQSFNDNSNIHEIVVVAHGDYHNLIKNIVEDSSFHKVKKILPSGSTRTLSTLSAVNAYQDVNDKSNYNFLIHDSARPLVSKNIIDSCISKLQDHKIVTTAVSSVNTIVEAYDDIVSSTPPRDSLHIVQTPQCFRLDILVEAFKKFQKDKNKSNFYPTDDCSIVYRYFPDIKIALAKGDATNIKITYPEDILYTECLINLRGMS